MHLNRLLANSQRPAGSGKRLIVRRRSLRSTSPRAVTCRRHARALSVQASGTRRRTRLRACLLCHTRMSWIPLLMSLSWLSQNRQRLLQGGRRLARSA